MTFLKTTKTKISTATKDHIIETNIVQGQALGTLTNLTKESGVMRKEEKSIVIGAEAEVGIVDTVGEAVIKVVVINGIEIIVIKIMTKKARNIMIVKVEMISMKAGRIRASIGIARMKKIMIKSAVEIGTVTNIRIESMTPKNAKTNPKIVKMMIKKSQSLQKKTRNN